MNNKTIKLNELAAGDHIMKIIGAKKWMIKERGIGGVGVLFLKNGEIYRTSFVIYENGQLSVGSFAYKQFTEKFLPAVRLTMDDIKGTKFKKELFVDKQINMKMIPTKKDPSKTWAAEYKRHIEQNNQMFNEESFDDEMSF